MSDTPRTDIASELDLCSAPFGGRGARVRYTKEYLPSLRFYAKRLLDVAQQIVELLEEDQ
jgi:hypothetical protein